MFALVLTYLPVESRPRVLPCRQCPGLARRLALARPASCWLVPLARPAASGHKRRMAAYVLTAAAMSLPALGVLRCCCRRRVFTAASASLSTRPVIIDTDCALDDLATLALAAATGTSLQLVTTVSGLAPPGHGHELVRLHGQKRLTWQRRSSAVCVLLGAARHSPGR